MKMTRKGAAVVRWGTTIGGVVALGTALAVSGCSTQLNDLRNTASSYPDYAVTVLNVDNFPNITLLCFKGVAFATTTRDMNNIMLVPGWNAFCASKVGQHTSTGTSGKP